MYILYWIYHMCDHGDLKSNGFKSSDERMDDQKHIRICYQIKDTEAAIAHTTLSVPLLYMLLAIFG